jgi:hypothetical protein
MRAEIKEGLSVLDNTIDQMVLSSARIHSVNRVYEILVDKCLTSQPRERFCFSTSCQGKADPRRTK